MSSSKDIIGVAVDEEVCPKITKNIGTKTRTKVFFINLLLMETKGFKNAAHGLKIVYLNLQFMQNFKIAIFFIWF